MIVPVNELYRIVSDQYNWTIQRRHVTESGVKSWHPWKYYATLKQAAQMLAERQIRNIDVEGMVAIIDQSNFIIGEVVDAMRTHAKKHEGK